MADRKTVDAQTIKLDDAALADTVFTNCKLVYAGGSVQMDNTRFEHCELHLVGAALATTELLSKLNVKAGGSGVITVG